VQIEPPYLVRGERVLTTTSAWTWAVVARPVVGRQTVLKIGRAVQAENRTATNQEVLLHVVKIGQAMGTELPTPERSGVTIPRTPAASHVRMAPSTNLTLSHNAL
jgi:hypothetical protein